MSGKLPRRKIGPPVRLRVWFRISVRIRAGGQFSSEAIFLEPFSQGCYLKMLFQRKTLVTETYCVVNLPARVLQLLYSRTPLQVFICEFIREHPRAATSVLSLIKLLVSIKSKFSPRAFVLYLIFRSPSLFYHGHLEILISSSCKHKLPILPTQFTIFTNLILL